VPDRLEQVEAPGARLTHTAARALAVPRIATGFAFLWALPDKTFGFGSATPAAKAWINGGLAAPGPAEPPAHPAPSRHTARAVRPGGRAYLGKPWVPIADADVVVPVR